MKVLTQQTKNHKGCNYNEANEALDVGSTYAI